MDDFTWRWHWVFVNCESILECQQVYFIFIHLIWLFQKAALLWNTWGWRDEQLWGTSPAPGSRDGGCIPNRGFSLCSCWVLNQRAEVRQSRHLIFFWFFSGCQELHKPLNYVRTGGRTKVPWVCLSLLPCCLLCTQELCEPQSLWLPAGVCGHIDENRHVPKFLKTHNFQLCSSGSKTAVLPWCKY